MSTDLYEILGIQKDATDDQIRKAYRRLALQTHPDRVPPEQKLTAEDEFRKVNNAYEVLIDPTKRQAYDAAGVWPPPPPQPQSQPPQPRSRGSRHRHRPYRTSREPHVPFPEDPFDFGRHHHAGFTDPFRLFESIFDELRHAMSNPFLPDPWRRDRRHDPHQRVRDFFDASFIDMGFPFDRHGRSRRYNPHQRERDLLDDLLIDMGFPFDRYDRFRRHDPHQRVRNFFDNPLIDMGLPFDRRGGFDDMMGTRNGRTRVYSQVTRGAARPDDPFSLFFGI